MPADRTQLANERVDALVELMHESGAITSDQRDQLLAVDAIAEAHDIAEQATGRRPE